MPALQITVDDSIRTAWPDTCLGCLWYTVDVTAESTVLPEYYAGDEGSRLVRQLGATELATMPNIGESRAAYKRFGVDPGRRRVASEALYRRLRQKKPLYQINSLVDVNNLASLKTGYSLGSYDAAHIGGDIVFRLGKPGEVYAGIGKDAVSLANMPVLADIAGPFGSPTSDSTRAMITLDTRQALTVVYSFSGRSILEGALPSIESCFAEFAAISNMTAWIL